MAADKGAAEESESQTENDHRRTVEAQLEAKYGHDLLKTSAIFPVQISIAPKSLSSTGDEKYGTYGLSIDYIEGYGWHVNAAEIQAILSMSCYTANRQLPQTRSRLYQLHPGANIQPRPESENIMLNLLGDPDDGSLFNWWLKHGSMKSLLRVAVAEEAPQPAAPKISQQLSTKTSPKLPKSRIPTSAPRDASEQPSKPLIPTCPQTSQESDKFKFRILATNIIENGGEDDLSLREKYVGTKWRTFYFQSNDVKVSKESPLSLAETMIDSRKVYIPVVSKTEPENTRKPHVDHNSNRIHGNDATSRGNAIARASIKANHRDPDPHTSDNVGEDLNLDPNTVGVTNHISWQLATISPLSVELTCAQTVYTRFLDALFCSTQVGKIQEKLGRRVRVESPRKSNQPQMLDHDFTIPKFRLRNDGIDKLVQIVGESGLYDALIAAELRVLSSLSHADLLPPATEAILEWVYAGEPENSKRGRRMNNTALHDKRTCKAVTCPWLLNKLVKGGPKAQLHLRDVIVHCLESLLCLFRSRCVVEAHEQPMIGGPWAFLQEPRTELMEQESWAARNLGLVYNSVEVWLQSDERNKKKFQSSDIDMLLQLNRRLHDRSRDEQKRITELAKTLVQKYLEDYKTLSTANRKGWDLLCGNILSSPESTRKKQPASPIKFPFGSTEDMTTRAGELFVFCEAVNSNQSKETPEKKHDTKSTLATCRYQPFSLFSIPDDDPRSWVPFHFSIQPVTSDITSGNHRLTKLHCAAATGNQDMIKQILDLADEGSHDSAKVDIDAFDDLHRTPLYLATCGNHTQAIVILLRKGADIYASDRWGRSSVHIAIASRNQLLLKLLISKGKGKRKETPMSGNPEKPTDGNDTINNPDIWGYAPIHYAIVSNEPQMIQYVCKTPGFCLSRFSPQNNLFRREQQGPRLSVVADNISQVLKVPALHLANTIPTIEALQKAIGDNGQIDICESDSTGRTFLHAAAELGANDVIQYLLGEPSFQKLLVPKRTIDKSRKTPLHLAATELVVYRLLESDTIFQLLNNKDVWGCTVLHDAVSYNRLKVVEALISRGADTSVADRNGKTPENYAAGEPKLLKILQDASKGKGNYSRLSL